MMSILCISNQTQKVEAISELIKGEHLLVNVLSAPAPELFLANDSVDLLIVDWRLIKDEWAKFIGTEYSIALPSTILFVEKDDNIHEDHCLKQFIKQFKPNVVIPDSQEPQVLANGIRVILKYMELKTLNKSMDIHELTKTVKENNSSVYVAKPKETGLSAQTHDTNNFGVDPEKNTRNNIAAEVLIEGEIVLLKNLRTSLKDKYKGAQNENDLRWLRYWLNQVNEYIKKLQNHVIIQELGLVDNPFLKVLKQKYPQLTSNDLKICALIRMQFSVKQVADYLLITPESVRAARYRMRKKLELPSDITLEDFLLGLDESRLTA